MDRNTTLTPNEAAWTIEKLNDRAYQEIKNQIIRHELKPGTRLVDSQLAERYGISRTPVRDAIRKLAEEGLVVSSGKKGYFVFQPTRQDIVEIFEIRLMLDRAAFHKLLTEMLPGNYVLYSAAIDRIETRLREDISLGERHFSQYDEDFHSSFIKLTNNGRLAGIYLENLNQNKGFRYHTAYDEDRIDKANRMHFAILKAVKEMDLAETLRCVTEHVELTRKDALSDYDYFTQPSEE